MPSALSNPVNVVVTCRNLPLNSEVILEAKPANGPAVTGVGYNSAGTTSTSTATISMNLPRGVGTLQAKAVSGIVNLYGAAGSVAPEGKEASYAVTGLTADGERFAQVEVSAGLGGSSKVTYITTSGKRLALLQ